MLGLKVLGLPTEHQSRDEGTIRSDLACVLRSTRTMQHELANSSRNDALIVPSTHICPLLSFIWLRVYRLASWVWQNEKSSVLVEVARKLRSFPRSQHLAELISCLVDRHAMWLSSQTASAEVHGNSMLPTLRRGLLRSASGQG